MREAEEAFAREVRRLQGPTEETQSYQSASSGAGVGVGIGQTMGVPQPMGGGRNRPPSWNGRHAVSATWDSCSCASGISFDRGFANLGTTQAPCRLAHSSVSADVRCASEWWGSMVQGVENHDAQWLTASPLEKLRMRPTGRIRRLNLTVPFTFRRLEGGLEGAASRGASRGLQRGLQGA